MFAKRFFYVSASLFLLALSYHLGARSADAQAPGNPVVGVAYTGGVGLAVAVTANGDSYLTSTNGTTWAQMGNIFGGPTATTGTSWGKVKADYRK